MAKTSVTRRRTKQSKVVTSEAVEEKDSVDAVSQMDTVIEVKGITPTVSVSWDKKSEEAKVDDTEKGTNASDQMMDSVKGKRKAQSAVETPSSKKSKLIDNGYCVFVGNLNNSKTFKEVKDSLENYFMSQSLLVQDIRLHRSKKYAHVHLASEMDLTKALTLNGEIIHDKPMNIAKAKIESEDKVKVKDPLQDKKDKDARCLFLKNVPYSTTEQDIMTIFPKAVAVRFPGGAKTPNKGIAFVEFRKKTIAQQMLQKKQVLKIQGRDLVVNSVGKTNVPKVDKAKEDSNNKAKAAAPPNKILFVSNLSYRVKDKDLSKFFQNAVNISIPECNGKSRGFGFVEFETVEDAEKALQSSKNINIYKKKIRVEYWEKQPEKAKVLSKTLIVVGLTEKTSAETLKSAFEGALDARVTVDKETSKRFGFVDFENEEICKDVKEAMKDCEIDGSKVTVGYAKPRGKKGPSEGKKAPSEGKKKLMGRPGGHPAGRDADKGGKGSRKKGRARGAVRPRDAVKEKENKT